MSDKFQMFTWPTRPYTFELPLRYHLSAPSETGLVICLHGYQDHALSMLKRLGWWQAELPFQILAVNGPFPVPIWSESGFIEAYSWYFREANRRIMLVDPMQTAQALSRLISDLGHGSTPKILFGFSQGGYLAPYLATQLTNVQAILGLGCGYPLDAYSQLTPLPVLGIHGDQDERVDLAQSQKEHSALTSLGHMGHFQVIRGLVHRVELSVEPLIRSLAVKYLLGE